MIINGMKVLADKGWKTDSVFQSDDGKTYNVPSNHKFVLIDENNDVVNATIVTSQPLSFKVGGQTPSLEIVGSCTKSQFGWSIKCAVKV